MTREEIKRYVDRTMREALRAPIDGMDTPEMNARDAELRTLLDAYDAKHPPKFTIECPCCGCTGAIGDAEGRYQDGQALVCGCAGCVSFDAETEPDISLNGDECPVSAKCHANTGRFRERTEKEPG